MKKQLTQSSRLSVEALENRVVPTTFLRGDNLVLIGGGAGTGSTSQPTDHDAIGYTPSFDQAGAASQPRLPRRFLVLVALVASLAYAQTTLALGREAKGRAEAQPQPKIAEKEDQMVKVGDVQTDQNLLTLKGHNEPVFSVAFSPDGKRLASGSHDKTVKVWDAQKR